MKNNEQQSEECRVVNIADYQRRKTIANVLNRPELSEEIKKYPSSVPAMEVVYNKEKEEQEEAELRKRFYALSDHLD